VRSVPSVGSASACAAAIANSNGINIKKRLTVISPLES
jgi:hypothetical protein